MHAEQQVEVRAGEITIDQHDAGATLAEGDREVRRQIALADAALAARDHERAHAAARQLRCVTGAEFGRRGITRLHELHDSRFGSRTLAHAASSAMTHRACTNFQ